MTTKAGGMSDLAHMLYRFDRKLDLILFNQGVTMADTSAAVAILNEIEGEESELATDYRGLLEKISTLSANQAPSQEEVDALTEHAAKIAAGFKALHEAEATDAPVPDAPETPVAPPAETPPVSETPPTTETVTPVSTVPPVSSETATPPVTPTEPAA